MSGQKKIHRFLFNKKVRRLVKVGVLLVVMGFAFVGLWYCFWTYLNPDTVVASPVSITIDQDGKRSDTSVLFLGDTAPADRAKKIVEKKGYAFPYAKTRSLLRAYDAVVANFEAPITTSENPSFLRPPKYRYKAAPAAAAALEEVGITAVSLANNHVKDYLNHGLSDTLEYLKKHGIENFGAGMTEADARRGLVLETSAGKIGLIGYMEDQWHWRLKNLSFALDIAGMSWPGVARFVEDDVAADMARMKKICDVVIVVVHWGKNYEPITDSQKSLGEFLIDLGADAVIGHHSHEAQPVGVYKGRPIIYSLGNYAFDTPGRRSMRFGFGAAIYLANGRIDRVEIIPLLTQNRRIKFQPRVPIRQKDADDFFDAILPTSKELGADIIRRGNRAWLYL